MLEGMADSSAQVEDVLVAGVAVVPFWSRSAVGKERERKREKTNQTLAIPTIGLARSLSESIPSVA